MTFVKICGITNPEDALAAVNSGADALGFNFYRPSLRYIDPSFARTVIDQLPTGIMTVGVFVNEKSPEIVEQIATKTGVRALQLHGDESPEFCAALTDWYVIKVLSIGADFNPRRVLDYEVKAIMVDALDKKARGGTGRPIDWLEARRARDLVPRLFLAGGLSPENVGQAISVVDPYAVDACSALETTPGKKNAARVEAFVKAAHAVR